MAEFLHCTSHSEGYGNMFLFDAHHRDVRYLTYGGTVVPNVHIMVLLRCVLKESVVSLALYTCRYMVV